MAAAKSELLLRDYLHTLRRRKLILLACVVVFPLGALAVSLREHALYRSSSKVVLRYEDLASVLSGLSASSQSVDPIRAAQTQIQLALSPEVGAKVLKRAGISSMTPSQLVGSTSITADPTADVLTFSVTNGDPVLATRLANAYAAAYTVYRRSLDTQSLNSAIADVNKRIEQLNAAGDPLSLSYTKDLVAKAEQLRTLKSLQTSNARVFEVAEGAGKVQPRPVRSGLLGLGIGLVLGIGLAFLAEALDTRVRGADEVGQRLDLPILARVPEPPRRLQQVDELVMLAEPNKPEAEAFRVLRTNLDFVNLDAGARSILITSALEEEGKSTTAANLAVALARAGRRVVLVDMDLRRPYLDKFFDLQERPGLTNVVLGHATLDEALVRIALTANQEDHGFPDTNGQGAVDGLLEVLPTGPTPPDPGEFVGTRRVAEILGELRTRADFVLIDSPPILHVGDALTLAARVDSMLVLVRQRKARVPTLKELRRVLDTCPARVLGVVIAGLGPKQDYGYGGYYYGYYSSRPQPAARGASVGESTRRSQ
jgi:succinoglycan biosynthesis transport protein ExoP